MRKKRRAQWRGVAIASLLLTLFVSTGSRANRAYLVLQSTTSTQNSGLLEKILPRFKAASGIEVRVVAVGTGQALKNARNGDGDVLLVHAKEREETFVAEGYGVERFDLMYNDFVLVGPSEDPAGVGGSGDVDEALKKIAASSAVFVSRGDDSGTHSKELSLWADAGVDAPDASGTWYRETGSGMGATLNVATEMDAYTLTDRGTWIRFENKQRHEILFEGDPRLFNQYGVILVNPDRHPRVLADSGRALIDWLLSEEGQAAIAAYKIGDEQLFFPNAKRSETLGK